LFSGNKAWKLEGDQKESIAKLIAEGIPENAFIRLFNTMKKQNILFIGTDSKGIIVVRRIR
jgi:succinyl-CoA synthetase alpha subunit